MKSFLYGVAATVAASLILSALAWTKEFSIYHFLFGSHIVWDFANEQTLEAKAENPKPVLDLGDHDICTISTNIV